MSEPKWLEIARAELGVSEVAGSGDNPRIIEYHKSTTLKATKDEVPWCASYIGWSLQEAGITPTHSAAARSYCNYGKELKKPKLGCIVVLKRGSNPSSGHVGFFIEEDMNRVKLLSGNVGDKVCIAWFPKSDIISLRWPN